MKMSEANATLNAILRESGKKFEPAELERFINAALSDLGRVKPLKLLGELALVADQALYDAPADLVEPLYSNWGKAELSSNKPWNGDWPGRLPRLGMVRQSGVRMLELDPAPTQRQINLIGSAYAYHYRGSYVLGDTEEVTTVPAALEQALLVRAAAEAMLSLAMGGVTKPVMLGKAGVGGMPKNGAPAFLADELLGLFERLAA
jgi:hypothetical protein